MKNLWYRESLAETLSENLVQLKFFFIFFFSLLSFSLSLLAQKPKKTLSGAVDTAVLRVQYLQQNPFDIPLLGEDCNFRTLTPQSLDRDAEVLMNKWNKAYRENTLNYQPMHSSFSSPTEEGGRRNRMANLPTDLDLRYNVQVKKSLDLYLRGKKHFIPAMLSLGDFYFPIIETIFDRYNIPLELKYLAVVESGLDPTVTSYAGAKGMWQFMLVTAKAYGLEVNSIVDERLDVYKSTEAAARHFKDLYNIYGDWLICIAAYNAGIGSVNRAIQRSGGKREFWSIYNYLPRQTRDYVPLFIAAYYAMEYHYDYKFTRANFSLPTDLDTMYVSEKVKIADLVKDAEVTESFFRLINPQFKGKYIPGNLRHYAISLPMSAISKLLTINGQKKINKAPEESSTTPPSPQGEAIQATPQKNIAPKRSYTIKKGDSLYKIARKHGVSLASLMEVNEITSTDYKLIPGSSLKIPE